MSGLRNRGDIAILAAILIATAAAVALFISHGVSEGLLGAVLVAMGGFAIMLAPNMARGIHQLTAWLSRDSNQPSGMRTATVVLWGIGLAIVGAAFILGL